MKSKKITHQNQPENQKCDIHMTHVQDAEVVKIQKLKTKKYPLKINRESRKMIEMYHACAITEVVKIRNEKQEIPHQNQPKKN